MTDLTAKQRQVLVVIAQALVTGPAPTIREIGREIGVSSSCTVASLIGALEKKGYVTRERCKYRSLRLTAAGWQAVPEVSRPCTWCHEPISSVPVVDDVERCWCSPCAARGLAKLDVDGGKR